MPVNALNLPPAVDPAMVGQYSWLAKSGAGYVWDEVLEYRVWTHKGGSDAMKAFATFEAARDYSERTYGAEPPLVLIRQKTHINEPERGKLVYVEDKERITEWQPHWLREDNRNTPENRERIIEENSV